MCDIEQLQSWAITRAQHILTCEGTKLVHAAQWLDKKGTQRGAYELRAAIEASLLEALQLMPEEISWAAPS